MWDQGNIRRLRSDLLEHVRGSVTEPPFDEIEHEIRDWPHYLSGLEQHGRQVEVFPTPSRGSGPVAHPAYWTFKDEPAAAKFIRLGSELAEELGMPLVITEE
jgi:hypothetical protein